MPKKFKLVRICLMLLVFTVFLFLTTCDLTEIVTIEWLPDETGDYRQFSTNDLSKCSNSFIYDVDVAPMGDVVEAQIKKVSGSSIEGYGLVFRYQDPENYYKLLITVNRWFMMNQIVNGVPRDPPLIDYTNATWLWPDYNKVNTVKIEDVGAGEFDISFNGHFERTVEPDAGFPGGSAGYYVSVAHEKLEFFPYVPVDVRFKLLQPAVDPPPP